MPRRALLITMPWMAPGASCLALATLGQILERAGEAVDTLYGNVLFPRTDTRGGYLASEGGFLFVPYLYPDTDVDALIERIIDTRFSWISFGDLLADDSEELAGKIGLHRDELRAAIRADIARAGVCLERCLAKAVGYDVIGFSVTFETQLPACLALARRLKERDPSLKIAFGGAACVEEQADGIVRSFDIVDVVCHTEGEEVIVPLLAALRGEGALADVPGIAYRDGAEVRHNASPPLLEDLDRLPVPRYDDFLAQLAASEWRVGPVLFFETSRGCWWGQKHLCTFCGLNADGLAFRSKSAERAYEEIEHLYRAYPAALMLQATDNILEVSYFNTVLPRLARMARDPDRPLNIFYEVKSNMTAGQVALLHAAGITRVQPGIESFSDAVLQLMDKGSTGLRQVQFIKWAQQEKVELAYNLIVNNPGESAEVYEEMLALLPFISHLPPPRAVLPMLLMRFSPYFERSAQFGIEGKRPFAYYRWMYPDPKVDLDRIAYQFEYDHPMQREPKRKALAREFTGRVLGDWKRNWMPARAFHLDAGDHITVYDQRRGASIVTRIDGVEADLYRYLDAVRPFAAIERRFAAELPTAALRQLLALWQERRWAVRSPDDLHLVVIPLMRRGARSVDDIVAAAVAPAKPQLRVVG